MVAPPGDEEAFTSAAARSLGQRFKAQCGPDSREAIVPSAGDEDALSVGVAITDPVHKLPSDPLSSVGAVHTEMCQANEVPRDSEQRVSDRLAVGLGHDEPPSRRGFIVYGKG